MRVGPRKETKDNDEYKGGESPSKLLKNGIAKLYMKISSKKAIAMKALEARVEAWKGICTAGYLI